MTRILAAFRAKMLEEYDAVRLPDSIACHSVSRDGTQITARKYPVHLGHVMAVRAAGEGNWTDNAYPWRTR